MRRVLPLCIAAILICACSKIDKEWLAWNGEKEIPYSGGTVIWRPGKKSVRTFPVINALYFNLYNYDGECISSEKVQDVRGDWYEITTAMNTLSILFSANETGYLRELQISFEDGITRGGHTIAVVQNCK